MQLSTKWNINGGLVNSAGLGLGHNSSYGRKVQASVIEYLLRPNRPKVRLRRYARPNARGTKKSIPYQNNKRRATEEGRLVYWLVPYFQIVLQRQRPMNCSDFPELAESSTNPTNYGQEADRHHVVR